MVETLKPKKAEKPVDPVVNKIYNNSAGGLHVIVTCSSVISYISSNMDSRQPRQGLVVFVLMGLLVHKGDLD